MATESALLLLSDLDPTKRRITVCARVSRMWDYMRDGKLVHVDLVLIDEKGNKMIAEIASGHATQYKDLLQEGNVYLLRDFFIQSSKAMFRPVDSKFMIRITPWTKISPKNDVPPDFPYYAYSLTPFDLLPTLVGKKESFIDVLGIVIAISELLHVQLPGQSAPSVKRNLRLMDIDGRTVDVALWGARATEFDGNHFYKEAQSRVLIALLVGTLIKNYRGKDTISCGDAAKIYMDPNIPEKEAYYAKIGQRIPIVEWIAAEKDQYRVAFHRSEPDAVKIEDLLSTDPNEFLGKNMICTVTIMRVQPGSWWFLACSACHKTAYPAGNEFACSDQNCSCTAANPRYKLRLIGADHTGEAQFVFFAQVAEQIIGKKVEALIRAAARRPDVIPAEIASLVTQKYSLNVSINEKGLQYGELSFQVNKIDLVHPRLGSFQFRSLGSASEEQPSGSKDIVPVQSLGMISKVQPIDLPDTSLSIAGDITIREDKTATTDDPTSDKHIDHTVLQSPPPPELISTPPSAPRHVDDTSSTGQKDTKKRPPPEPKKSSAAKKLFNQGDQV